MHVATYHTMIAVLSSERPDRRRAYSNVRRMYCPPPCGAQIPPSTEWPARGIVIALSLGQGDTQCGQCKRRLAIDPVQHTP